VVLSGGELVAVLLVVQVLGLLAGFVVGRHERCNRPARPLSATETPDQSLARLTPRQGSPGGPGQARVVEVSPGLHRIEGTLVLPSGLRWPPGTPEARAGFDRLAAEFDGVVPRQGSRRST
jgi:hypothetical protein